MIPMREATPEEQFKNAVILQELKRLRQRERKFYRVTEDARPEVYPAGYVGKERDYSAHERLIQLDFGRPIWYQRIRVTDNKGRAWIPEWLLNEEEKAV